MTVEELAAKGLRVKPLVWEGNVANCYIRAISSFGIYEVGAEYGDEWFCDFTCNDERRPKRLSNNQDGAANPKAAAEADNAARIAAQIEAKP